MAQRRPRNGAVPSQSHQNAVKSALHTNLQRSLKIPACQLKSKLSEWDRTEIADSRKFAKREKQVEQHLAKNTTTKPSLRISKRTLNNRARDREIETEDQEEQISNDHDVQHSRDRHREESDEPQFLPGPSSCPDDGVFDAENYSAIFDMKKFKEALKKADKNEEIPKSSIEKFQEHSDEYRKSVFIDAEQEKTLPHCSELIARDAFENPFVKAIIASNHKLFFELYIKEMKEDGDCTEKCLCWLINISSPKMCKNPLHLAAAVSSVEFLENVAADTPEMIKSRSGRIIKLLEGRSERIDKRKAVEHYEAIVNHWMRTKSREHMYPIDTAIEHGRFAEFEVMWGNNTYEIMYGTDVRSNNFGEHIDPPIHKHFPSMLSRLVQHGNLIRFHDRGYDENDLFEQLNIHKKRYAVSLAARNGDMNTLKRLEENLKMNVFEQRNYNIDEKLVVPGKILRNGGFIDHPVKRSPVSHELAENGHFEQFNSLETEHKLVKDFYSCTALVSLLQFSDEQVKSQLKLFGKTEREDLFIFVAQIIVKNRRELLKDALNLALMNPDNFDVNPKFNDLYQDYGLPDYVPLPMETALSRTGDMTLMEMIADVYQRFIDKHRRKMIEEDALRCIKSIQDRASRCSEQIRLAVILMMFPFAPPSSPRFKKLLQMYSERGESDAVSEYVLKTHSVSWRKYTFEKWNVVFEKAGVEVKKWNKTVDIEQVRNNINPQVNKGIGKNVMFFPIIKNTQGVESRQKQKTKKPKSIDEVMPSLVKAVGNIRI